MSESLLLRHCRIPAGPWLPAAPAEPTWVAIRGGRIVGVGEAGQPEPEAGFTPVELAGSVVLPGFVDAHTHLGWSAQDRWTVDLSGAGDRAQVLATVAAIAARLPAGQWVVGGDWTAEGLPDAELPGRAELDAATAGHPLFLVSRDHRVALANSAALARAKVDRHTPDPAGGVIEREAGEPTGLLRGGAVWARLVAGVVPPRDRSRELAEIADALADLAARGITEVHDIGTFPERALGSPPPEFFRERSFTDVTLLAELDARSPLSLRYSFRPSLLRVDEYTGRLPVLPERIRLAGFKMSLDNGWYSVDPENRSESFRWPGLPEVVRLARIADRHGLPVSVHAIGDLGVREALDLMGELPRRRPGVEAVHRIIHARRMAAADIARCADLGVAVEVQPWEVVNSGARLTAMGDDAFAAGIGPFRALLDAGAAVLIGSDRRLGTRVDQRDTDPLTAVELCVTRSDGPETPIWQPEQRISLTEAFAAAGTAGAIAAGARSRGRIAPGQDADLVVLGADPWSLPPHQVHTARPVLTVSAGRIVFTDGVAA